MAHGYLRDDNDSLDRGGDRERWDDESMRAGRGGNDQDRFMLSGRDRDRGFSGRDDDDARQRFREEDHEWRGTHEDQWNDRDRRAGDADERSAFTSRGGWERSPRGFRSHQDDHYRSWRDQQLQALDRDYADFCREREQQFHQDFDTWRSQRRGNNPGPLRTGMTQTGQSHDPSGMLELTNEASDNAEPRADPMDAATLGTNSSSGGGGV
jgi:hypothetical protein